MGKKPNRGGVMVLTLGFFALFIIIYFMTFGASNTTQYADPNTHYNSKPKPAGPPAPIYGLELYEEAVRKGEKELTDLQWEQYAKTLEHKKVRWRGHVTEVDKTPFSNNYTISISLDKNDFSDVTFEASYDRAIMVDKGSYYVITGVIKKAYKLLGTVNFRLKDVRFERCSI